MININDSGNVIHDFRSKPPKPAEPKIIAIKDALQSQLANGLKIILVENHKLPHLTLQLFTDNGEWSEEDIAGCAELTSHLLLRGTNKMSKEEFDEALDFLGAEMYASTSGGGISGLSKYAPDMMSLMADAILIPAFHNSEFELVKKQALSGLSAQREEAGAISDNIGKHVTYGSAHPYGAFMTEESVHNMTLSDCINFHKNYFYPNISYLIAVGDIKMDELIQLADKNFSNWKMGEFKKQNVNYVELPAHNLFYLVHKTDAVQSVISVTYPVDLKPDSPDRIQASLLNQVLGGYFSSRLNKNLREEKGYTYGIGSSINADEYVGEFHIKVNVRNEVTVPAVKEILLEMKKLRTERISEEELNEIKNVLTGNFTRSLENPAVFARFALNIARYNLPADYYKTYLQKIAGVTIEEIYNMAQKYMHPENAHIVVVGNKGELFKEFADLSGQNGVNILDYEGKVAEELS